MKTTDFQRTVKEFYATGARLIIMDENKLAIDGEVPKELRKEIRAKKPQFLEMLIGDPLMGFGWEGRTALFDQAIRWLDEKTKAMGGDAYDRATEALTSSARIGVYDRLNEGWCDSEGDIEIFREALRDYIRVGLDAAKGKKPKMRLRA